MVEVDRERGRIGLRLAEDPEIAGKSVEELATVGAGGGGGGGNGGGPRRERSGGGDRGPRRDRDGGRGGDRGDARAAPAARATAPTAIPSGTRQPCAKSIA